MKPVNQYFSGVFLALLTRRVYAACLVDKCASCANPKANLCEMCKSGWYKRTFDGGDDTYDEC